MNVLSNLKLEPYGYSHGPAIGIKISGIPAGHKIDFDQVDKLLLKRKGSSKYNTTRSESEQLILKQGFENQVTTGRQIWIEIEQSNFKQADYQFGTVRPGHADLSAYQKYGNDWQFSGGGQFSGRLTILYVIAGEIARQILVKFTDLKVLGHVSKVGSIVDCVSSAEQLETILDEPFPMVDQLAKQQVIDLLSELKANGDSIGGKLDIYVTNLATNYGEDFFGSLESKISFLMYSIPAVKAVEFGIGTEFSMRLGSEVVEQLEVENGQVKSRTNYNGGISGGIANLSTPIKFSLTIKPTSTIFSQVNTVKYNGQGFEEATLQMRGRHDSFIANRALWPAIGLMYILFLDMELNNVK